MCIVWSCWESGEGGHRLGTVNFATVELLCTGIEFDLHFLWLRPEPPGLSQPRASAGCLWLKHLEGDVDHCIFTYYRRICMVIFSAPVKGCRGRDLTWNLLTRAHCLLTFSYTSPGVYSEHSCVGSSPPTLSQAPSNQLFTPPLRHEAAFVQVTGDPALHDAWVGPRRHLTSAALGTVGVLS